MKTNVNYRSKNFYVNPEKKTVVCNLTSIVPINKIPMYDFLDSDFDFWDALEENFDVRHMSVDGTPQTVVVFNTKGKSKAHGSDEFDEQLGRYASLTRAQENAFYNACKLYLFVRDYLDNKIYKLDILAENSLTSALNCNKHVAELLGITPDIDTDNE